MSAFDLAKPMALRAEMARGGIAPNQLHPYEDPERGYVDPLADPDVQTIVRRFMAALWRACEQAEAREWCAKCGDLRSEHEPSRPHQFTAAVVGDSRPLVGDQVGESSREIEACQNFTARRWSPLADRAEDGRCVNCGQPEASHNPMGSDHAV